MKGALVGALSGALLTATIYTATAGGSSNAFLTARAGDSVRFVALDLFCVGMRRDPDGIEAGPIIYCKRYSTDNSRAISVSRYHYLIGNQKGISVCGRSVSSGRRHRPTCMLSRAVAPVVEASETPTDAVDITLPASWDRPSSPTRT